MLKGIRDMKCFETVRTLTSLIGLLKVFFEIHDADLIPLLCVLWDIYRGLLHRDS